MPQFVADDIPELPDDLLEQLLNTTVAELVPGSRRLQNLLYQDGICIVADLLREDCSIVGYHSHVEIAKALRATIQALIESSDKSPTT